MDFLNNISRDTLFLVTGGAGFIGSNIVETLISLGFRVRVLDNFSTGKRENLKDFINNDRFELIEGDIRSEDTCFKSCEGVTYVLHQGALGSVPRSVKDPITSHNVNATGTLNMLWAAKESGVKRFVYASSSSVYGDNPDLPKIESKLGNVLSPYAATKLSNEHYARLFYELYGFETVGLRYFNVFGKHQDPHSVYAAVIPIFLKQLLAGSSPLIHGDGEQSRDFTYIQNVIQANLRACIASSAACGRAYNISCGDRTSLNELYSVLTGNLGVDIKPTYGPMRAGDIKHSQADITESVKYLAYKPEIRFAQGIALTIDWYKANL